MEASKLKEILEKHKMWLNGEEGGEKADLSGANLRGADLYKVNLREADLSGADLRGTCLICADLSGANLRGACLICADLSGANLRGVDLSEANLRGADLSGADLRDANLSGADLDYASYPLYCNGLCIHVDDRIGIQLLYHAISNILFSHNTSDNLKKQVSALVDTTNKFHRVDECGKLKPFVKEDANNE